MRILLFGGWGQLGSDLVTAAEGRHQVVRPSHDEVDITEADAIGAAIASDPPDVVVNAAAFNKVELIEQNPFRAFAVNAVGAWHVGKAAEAVGARCVYVSTDYVFDGDVEIGYAEDDLPAPVNLYGLSKAAGERAVRLACADTLVVRGAGLFGHAGSSGKGGNFVETMLAKASAGEAISVVDDQVVSPTATHDLAERILLLLEHRALPGLYHAANGGSCSWYGFAAAIFRLAGVSPALEPRTTTDADVPRPRRSVLLDTKTAALGLPPMRPWEDALGWYLEQRPGDPAISRN
jgi:dTDP-4-dehydrorhamnose reductase